MTRLAGGTGKEAILPKMAAAAVEAVDVLGVAKVGAAEGFGQRLRRRGAGDEVDVVGHQAPAEDLEAVFFGVFFED